ncbi:MAG: tetratricopeptide repeat protein [Burkholderiaceae bacterium]|jgi:hypothetical protein
MRLAKFPLILSLLAALIFSSSVLADPKEPSLHEVYQKIAAGQYTQADAMMKGVLENHPNSAKAHYIVAELRLKEGRLDEGRAELARAEALAPGLPFAQADAVQKLRTQLVKSSGLGSGSSSASSIFSSPIFWLLMAVLVGGLIYFMKLRKREQANAVALGKGPQSGSAPNPTGGPPNGPGGPGSPNGPAGAPNTGFGGSGLMGSLATGAALGAGMVAGQALASHLMGGEHGNRDASGNIQPPQTGRENTDFGVRDVSTWDDSAGSGNSDWDDSGGGNFMDDV